MYTVPIVIHPKSGDTSSAAPIPHTTNRNATEIISRLSVERLFINSLSTNPSPAPIAMSSILYTIGNAISPADTLPPSVAVASDIATENATRLTTSSSATAAKSVSTKSPCAFVWRMVIIVEAGAVADASAASTTENARSNLNAK